MRKCSQRTSNSGSINHRRGLKFFFFASRTTVRKQTRQRLQVGPLQLLRRHRKSPNIERANLACLTFYLSPSASWILIPRVSLINIRRMAAQGHGCQGVPYYPSFCPRLQSAINKPPTLSHRAYPCRCGDLPFSGALCCGH